MAEPPLLEVCELGVTYPGRTERTVPALAGVSFSLERGEALAVAGRSGSGKSTLAHCLAGHVLASSGEIFRSGKRMSFGHGEPSVQLVFQDSPAALNPRWTARDLLGEPLRIQRFGGAEVRRDRVHELASMVGLRRACLDRRPGELSGGERQRIAIARALSVERLELLILDEPLRGLDAPGRRQVLELVSRLQVPAVIYISHDLAPVRVVASKLLVLDGGRVAEYGSTSALLAMPRHAATRSLLEAVLPES